MFKDFLLARHAPDKSLTEVQTYLEYVHAPLALSVTALAQELQRYTMNHVVSDDRARCALHAGLPGLATVVEHVLGGWPGIGRFSVDPDYLAHVKPDEQHMETTLLHGPPPFVAVEQELPIFHSEGTGALRIFDFIRAATNLTHADFLTALDQDGQAWARSAPYQTAVTRRVHSIVGGGVASFGAETDPIDAVIEIWVHDYDVFGRLRDDQLARRAAFYNIDRSFSAVTIQRTLKMESNI